MSTTESCAQDDFLDDLLGDFLDESGQLLERLNENLLLLDDWVRSRDGLPPERCDIELMNDLFRAAHSIKGLSAMLGLGDVNQLTHKIENVFDAARSGRLYFDHASVELLFQAADALSRHIERVRDRSLPRVDDGRLQKRIQMLLQDAGADREPSQQGDVEASLAAALAQMEAFVESENSAAHQHCRDVGVTTHNSPNAMEACALLEIELVENAPAAVLGVEAMSVSSPDPFEAIVDELEAPSKYLAIFIDEAEESIDSLAETLLAIEHDRQPHLTERLLLIAHRIKGSSASIGLNRCAKLAHAMEDVMQTVHEAGTSPSPEAVEALLCCTDALRGYVAGLRSGEPDVQGFSAAWSALSAKACRPTLQSQAGDTVAARLPAEGPNPTADHSVSPVDPAEEVQAYPENLDHYQTGVVEEVSGCLGSELASASGTDGSPTEEEVQRAEQLKAWCAELCGDWPDNQSVIAGHASFSTQTPMQGLKALLLMEKLNSIGKVSHSDPPTESLGDLEELPSWKFAVVTDVEVEQIRAQLRIAAVSSLELVNVFSPNAAASGSHPCVELPPEQIEASAESRRMAKKATSPSTEEHPAEEGQHRQSASPKGLSPDTASELVSRETSDPPARVAANAGTCDQIEKPDRGGKPTETLRVDIERLDHLMNLAGQLVINKARFSQIGESLRNLTRRKRKQALPRMHAALSKLAAMAGDMQSPADSYNEIHLHVRRLQMELQSMEEEVQRFAQVRTTVMELSEAIHQLERVSDGFQHAVMETRMVPIGPLFNRFRRVVRDITRSMGKEIRLHLLGEKTELDKRMIDGLGDPLIHMVRNSADHGIEPPEARLAAGKPAQGTITLNAFHRGNCILIQVQDDGRGLDEDRIRAKAVQKGLLTAADAEKLTSHQVFQLIWEPGFTTAAEVTEISGRGMGMDIVRAKIEELNGTVELDSRLGEGTVFTIRLPLTLAILPCLLSEIDGDVYALPMEAVREIVRRRPDEMSTVHGRLTTRVRDRIVSIVELRDLFAWNEPSLPTNLTGEKTLVVIGEPGREVGLAVDRLLGEEDVVIKSMAENYHNVPGIAGASILGDGRVSLILDVNAMIEMASVCVHVNNA